MGDVVNLKRVRKSKTRLEAERAAAENRVAFGRSKTEKASSEAQKEMIKRKFEGHKRNGKRDDV